MKLKIKSTLGAYSVEFFASLKELVSFVNKEKYSGIIMDDAVAKLYPTLHLCCDNVSTFSYQANEENKTPKGLFEILAFMQEKAFNKQSKLLVIGGGITQDVSSLAAQLFYRGIAYTLIPTTALSMADSCVGSKSSLNFNGYKNQLGGFYPPEKIYICSEFLNTLSTQEIYSGLGEIFKLYIIDKRVHEFKLTNLFDKQQLNHELMIHYIHETLSIKKQYVEVDEFDTGVRRILNYGHTFGHAYEKISNYQLPHGLAVLLGIDIANYIAYRLNRITESSYRKISNSIHRFYSWGEFNINIDLSALVNALKKDKKADKNSIKMILLNQQEELEILPVKIDANLFNTLDEYFSISTIFQMTSSENEMLIQ